MEIGICLLSYLMGAVPFGYLAARIAGIDITKQGSGNIGATNVLRALGLRYAVPVLLLDMGKGALAAYLGLRCLGLGRPGAVLAGALAVAGHNWSVFLRFRGGKGVATTAGVALVAFPWLLFFSAVVFLFVVTVSRYVSLGSLAGVWSALLFSLTPDYGTVDRLIVLGLALAITYQHRSNIRRLLSGTENKLTFNKERTTQ